MKGSEERRLKEREVALYKRDSGQLVLHRVIEVYEEGYGIRGDNTFGLEKVRDDQILGVLTEVIRDGKTISVTDPEYLKYVERNLKSYPVRLAKLSPHRKERTAEDKGFEPSHRLTGLAHFECAPFDHLGNPPYNALLYATGLGIGKQN